MDLKTLICNCFQHTTKLKQKVWQVLGLHNLYAYTEVKSVSVVKRTLMSEKLLLKLSLK